MRLGEVEFVNLNYFVQRRETPLGPWDAMRPVSGADAFLALVGRKHVHGELSVFCASSPEEEVENAAGWAVASKNNRTDLYVVRIPHDVANKHVEITSESGDTGIHSVDSRHRNLRGTDDQFANMMSDLISQYHNGADLIRRIGEPQLRRMYSLFWGLTSGDTTIKGPTKGILRSHFGFGATADPPVSPKP